MHPPAARPALPVQQYTSPMAQMAPIATPHIGLRNITFGSLLYSPKHMTLCQITTHSWCKKARQSFAPRRVVTTKFRYARDAFAVCNKPLPEQTIYHPNPRHSALTIARRSPRLYITIHISLSYCCLVSRAMCCMDQLP